jgi:hypothetical protein
MVAFIVWYLNCRVVRLTANCTANCTAFEQRSIDANHCVRVGILLLLSWAQFLFQQCRIQYVRTKVCGGISDMRKRRYQCVDSSMFTVVCTSVFDVCCVQRSNCEYCGRDSSDMLLSRFESSPSKFAENMLGERIHSNGEQDHLHLALTFDCYVPELHPVLKKFGFVEVCPR